MRGTEGDTDICKQLLPSSAQLTHTLHFLFTKLHFTFVFIQCFFWSFLKIFHHSFATKWFNLLAWPSRLLLPLLLGAISWQAWPYEELGDAEGCSLLSECSSHHVALRADAGLYSAGTGCLGTAKLLQTIKTPAPGRDTHAQDLAVGSCDGSH